MSGSCCAHGASLTTRMSIDACRNSWQTVRPPRSGEVLSSRSSRSDQGRDPTVVDRSMNSSFHGRACSGRPACVSHVARERREGAVLRGGERSPTALEHASLRAGRTGARPPSRPERVHSRSSARSVRRARLWRARLWRCVAPGARVRSGCPAGESTQSDLSRLVSASRDEIDPGARPTSRPPRQGTAGSCGRRAGSLPPGQGTAGSCGRAGCLPPRQGTAGSCGRRAGSLPVRGRFRYGEQRRGRAVGPPRLEAHHLDHGRTNCGACDVVIGDERHTLGTDDERLGSRPGRRYRPGGPTGHLSARGEDQQLDRAAQTTAPVAEVRRRTGAEF